MSSYRFTVFTATFNRARTLPRVYESLKAQTFRDFEWLIVDDGSSDGTDELVKQWQAEAPFPIRYYWQENAGKQEAYNRGVKEARGELFLALDSDDACLPHALERFDTHWRDIEASPAASSFSAVTALARRSDGTMVGTGYPRDVFDSDSVESRYRYKVTGDKWGFQKTEILREHPFPRVPDGSFVPEGVVWNSIARKYKTRYVNEPLLTVWVDQDNRLTTTGRQSYDKKLGHVIWHRDLLNHHLRYLRYAPRHYLESAVQYTRFSLHGGVSPLRQLTDLKGWGPRALWLAGFPVGVVAYLRDRRRVAAAE
jgi:glycosyltransferase involved in cell wall biosynthesis